MGKRPPELAAFAALERPSRDVVEVLSAVLTPVSRSALLEFLGAVDSPAPGGGCWYHPKLSKVMPKLVAAGLVVQGNKQVSASPAWRELVLRQARREGRPAEFVPQLRRAMDRSLTWGEAYRRTYEGALRDFRLEFYFGSGAVALAYLGEITALGYSTTPALAQVLGNPFDPALLDQVPEELSAAFVAATLEVEYPRVGAPDPEVLAYALQLVERRGGDAPAAVRGALAQRALLRGEWAAAETLVEGREGAGNRTVLGAMAFLQGDDAGALVHYQRGLKLLRASTGKRKVFFPDVLGLFYVFALLRGGDLTGRKKARTQVRAALGPGEAPLRRTYQALDALLDVLLGERAAAPPVAESWDATDEDQTLVELLAAARAERLRKRGMLPTKTEPTKTEELPTLNVLGQALCAYWAGQRQAPGQTTRLEALCHTAATNGYRVVETATAELLGVLGRAGYPKRAERLQQELGLTPLVPVVTREEPWERTLAAALELFDAGGGSRADAGPGGNARLAWRLSWYGGDTPSLRPVEQRRSAKGRWSAGKNVALKRLREQPEALPFLTAQDVAVCAAIELSGGGGYWDRPSLVLRTDRALRALVGHSLVFLEDAPGTRVEVVRGEPELRVEREGERFHLHVVPQPEGASGVKILRESPTRVRVVEFGPRVQRLAELFGAKGLKLPAKAEARMHQVLEAAAAELTVQSDDHTPGALEEVSADLRPRVHLLPAGQGLRVELLVRPFGAAGPYCPPGAGGRSLIAEVEGRRVTTRRDLDAERQAAQAVVAACPALGDLEGEGETLAWVLDDSEPCLELLLQLQELGDEVVVEWPEGETLKPPYRAGLDALQLEFKKKQDWFAATGELRVDTDLTLSLRHLLDLAAASPARFLPLGDGRFLALTQTFRKRLDKLCRFTEPHDQGVRFHPLAAPALEECTTAVGRFNGGKAWTELLRRYREAQALTPEVPATLQAELRPYQVEGYRWLMRLAHWGVGACLADDMGLGKTLQTLALLLQWGRGGPCLVVAPTSVCGNWEAEAQRFAPSLRPVVFGPGDRGKTLAGLQPFDLVLTSYGLLLQEAERLAAVPWEVVVLDEAQAIKNAAAKRSQAALRLTAKFKVITTGTPIENHLGELWNLFRFVNPGLLGSQESFNRRFAGPIENGDRAAGTVLKRLVTPFLLRRTKTQVLDDLPSRTEILLRLELSPAEAAFYAAVRDRALERLAAFDGPPVTKRFQVLAELMRLRRACCHPRLVLPETDLPSAKLEAFGEILDELLANRHQALVFSQFVDHLAIVRAYVESRGVAYQYLDGSTPRRERQRRVAAFQAGEGELFLISLKAGGLGLNLTAADYVIHLDPWWNPAVEDQASDRAHRIGQTRPVTIYRLVAKGTIEEKIVELHRHKRDLADRLLEGADGGARLTGDDLLEILRGG